MIGLVLSVYLGLISPNPIVLQDRLARSEGIAVTVEEFTRRLPKVKATKNGFSFLRQLPIVRVPTNSQFGRLAPSSAEIESKLAAFSSVIALLDKASELHKARWSTDWKRPTELYAGLPTIKGGSTLLLLRGTLQARRGNVVSAVKDARRVVHLANQLMDQPLEEPPRVGQEILDLAIRAVASWAVLYPSQPAFTNQLISMVDSYRPVDPRLSSEYDYLALTLSASRLGAHTNASAGALVREGARMRWKALAISGEDQRTLWEEANEKIQLGFTQMGLTTFHPRDLVRYDPPTDESVQFAARMAVYECAQDALIQSPRPETFDTSSYEVPEGWTPLQYTFSGRTMEISTASGQGQKVLFVIP
ncbi:MAG: hypothetical protein JST40_08145 [Armatimonadetes bacterium]|nr:hypothetical protein [Armatimonadota bacterium]